mmetsp:Transcript_18559/g.23387  ORF Transcript_18559/g.23387 Transcript_18559/m.23387 type:complete len:94 (-) Transcript_18559:363-644(-)
MDRKESINGVFRVSYYRQQLLQQSKDRSSTRQQQFSQSPKVTWPSLIAITLSNSLLGHTEATTKAQHTLTIFRSDRTVELLHLQSHKVSITSS